MQKAKIIVAVRKRPLFQKQKSRGFTDVVSITNGNRVIISQMKQKVDLTKYIEESVFNFDHAFNEESTNEEIYSEIMSPLVQSAFQGAKVSCFAYGQTGSGKTHTMNGVMAKNIPGLYTLGAYDIFQKLSQPQNSHLTAHLSFYEIYCTKLYDLLNKRTQLVLRQDAKSNINVVGLSEIPIYCVQEFQNHLKIGSSQRVTSQNSANSQSSRSHAILQISLKNGKKGFGKVYFIDLAGNQRGADHMNMKKQTQIDGQEINKSLLQLKQCIRGLDQGKNHVPFRGSKLTMCLKDSFIGFCRTVMIGNISPSSGSSQNSLNTLRYADRVKQLKNNEQISKQDLKSRQMMLPRGNKNAIKIAISNSDDQDDIAEKKRKALQQYGIKPEDKRAPSIKQDNLNSDRRLSMGTSLKQNNQPAKGTSLAKNGLSNNSNRQIPLAKGLQQKTNNLVGRKQMGTPRDDIPDYQPRQVSNQSQLQPQRYRNQPMQIQRPHRNSVDMRKNLSGIVNYDRNKNMAGQNNSNMFSQQQNYNEYNIPMHQQPSNLYQQNYQNNTNPVYKANNFFSNNQAQINPQNNNEHQMNPSNNNKFLQQVPGINNRPVSSNNANFSSNRPASRQQQFQQDKNNYQRQNNNLQSRNLPQLNPQSWNQIVDCIQITRDDRMREELRERLNNNLLEQENDLINEHSNTLQSQIQKIKEEMEVIKVIEHDRNQLSSKEYAKMMYESIDDKIGQLEMLKQKLATFMYKLDDMEQIEQKFDHHRRQHGGGQDQQLLDDYY